MNHETQTGNPPDSPPAAIMSRETGLREIDRAIAAARQARSRMIVAAMSRLWRRFTRPARPSPSPQEVEPAANALAAIRSAGEILRDTPDLNPREHRRFTDIILAEEARLEEMLRSWHRRAV